MQDVLGPIITSMLLQPTVIGGHMDPVTQGALGAMAAICVRRRTLSIKKAAVIGCISGMAADIDVFIRSTDDPLLNLDWHRHFTHALLFAPIAALLIATIFFYLLRRKSLFLDLYVVALIGYATHGLIDACTSYGTYLWWPFSEQRVAWSIISIVDPIFTSLLLAGVLMACYQNKRRIAYLSSVFACLYLTLCLWQHHRATSIQQELGHQRGHVIERRVVKPSFGNNILYRSVYETNGQFYVDAIRIGWFSKAIIYPGQSIQPVTLSEIKKQFKLTSVQEQDIARFKTFSDGYIIQTPKQPWIIADLRYAILPQSVQPLWGIDLKRITPTQHVKFITLRKLTKEARSEFMRMLFREKI